MNRRHFLAHALMLPALGCSVRGAGGSSPLQRLGASTACLAGYTLVDALSELRRLRFDTVEVIAYTGARHSVGAIPGFHFHAASEAERQRVFEATRPFRHISAHLPFQDLQLFSPDESVRRAGLDQVRGALDGLAFLRGELGVMHVGWPGEGRTYRDIWGLMVDTLRRLGDYAGERGIRIGIETMQPGSVREYADLIAETDHPGIGATIDTGHIRGASDIGLPPERRFTEEGRARFNEVLDRLAATVGDRLLHVHLSDVRPSDWVDHRTLGTGVVDFPRFLGRLEGLGYRGLLVLELEEQDRIGALLASRAHVEPLLR